MLEENIKTFKDLVFEKKTCKAFPTDVYYKQAIIYFENGYGISVICGYGAHGSGEKPYECACLYKGEPAYPFDTPFRFGVTICNCDEKRVTELMEIIQKMQD